MDYDPVYFIDGVPSIYSTAVTTDCNDVSPFSSYSLFYDLFQAHVISRLSYILFISVINITYCKSLCLCVVSFADTIYRYDFCNKVDELNCLV